MLISVIFAWLTVLASILAVAKWIARKTGNKKINRFFHNIHIPFGWIAIACGLLHGLLAGNMPTATLQTMTLAPMLLSLNTGSFCFCMLVLLALSYYLRKKLPIRWMYVHRVLSIAMVVLLVLHLVNVGITLPSRIASLSAATAEDTAAAVTETVQSAVEGSVSDSVSDPDSDSAFDYSSRAEALQEQLSENAAVSAASEAESAVVESAAESTTDEAASSTAESADAALQETEIIASGDADATPVTFSGAELADGVYSGSAEGFKGLIYVTVTVEGGAVTEVTIDSNSDTPPFFESASGIVDTVVEEQSLDVDTVSGATFSSAGILNAIYDALSGAVVSGELAINQVDLSAIPRHGH